ncbi:cation:proton antiporter [uncultured Ramlibacter sp.]|uniref:cation:proton antiporter n=1 Tax=uncultured Ramlibacter sp. TaxID=260755 RepID=UPI002628F47C|nr:cation:proton antiporter [uncultured Ramlibacter sp.]
MHEIMAIWSEWLKPSAGLPTVQWSILLAVAAAAGHLIQRYTGLPKVVGYSVIGALAGLAGFSGAAWPLQGISLFLLELGVAVVLFEAGGRIALRWFRHNPMVLLQSLLEAALTFVFVYYLLGWAGVRPAVAEALALIAMASSPAVLSRVVMDTRAAGPVTERAMVLATLSTLYALTLVAARAGMMHRPEADAGLSDTFYPVLVVLGLSIVVGAALALALRVALRVMSPTSENTSILLITLIAAGTALAAHFGGSAPLAALLGGMLLKQLNPRPWAWPRQLGTASSLLVMLMFVLVSVVAAKADWNPAVAGLVALLVVARGVAKVLGVGLANWGSGLSWRQALWTGSAMSPMSSVALLLVSQFMASSANLGPRIASIALPAILLMEVLGSVVCTLAIYRAGESSKPWAVEGAGGPVQPGELRG